MTIHLAVSGRARRSDARSTAPSTPVDLMSVSFAVGRRAPGVPPSPEDSARVGHMRRIAAARLRHCGLDALRPDVCLIVSELLTNAILHSGTTTICLDMTVRDGGLYLAVDDGMRGNSPAPRPVDDDDESGRGLALVGSVVQEHGGTWGADRAGRVWCSLSLPAEDAQ
ncbi:ATP-binding protein [Streptomyces sp. NPDC051643]|uniref:ATP-binding protein n=1 Tax=Streptomyces sp. NPDC051643 TaxID=3365665 RepID=UPI00378BE4C1